MASQSPVLAEFTVTAWIPARAAASIWLRISASSGETITVGPAPAARSSAVATKYTADLPHPVRCTTSARRRCTTSAWIAVHWSSRSRAGGPASVRSTSSARARKRSPCPARNRSSSPHHPDPDRPTIPAIGGSILA